MGPSDILTSNDCDWFWVSTWSICSRWPSRLCLPGRLADTVLLRLGSSSFFGKIPQIYPYGCWTHSDLTLAASSSLRWGRRQQNNQENALTSCCFVESTTRKFFDRVLSDFFLCVCVNQVKRLSCTCSCRTLNRFMKNDNMQRMKISYTLLSSLFHSVIVLRRRALGQARPPPPWPRAVPAPVPSAVCESCLCFGALYEWLQV